jgi:PAS domain S-box-containing protein
VITSTAAVAALLIPGIGPGLGAFLFLAVLVSASYGGQGPGIVATAVAVGWALFLVLMSRGSLQARHVAGLVMLTGGGVLVTRLVEALHAARRRAEESRRWLNAVLTSIGDAVIATDAEGRVRFTNRVANALTGWGADEAAGRQLEEILRLVKEEDGAPAENPVERVLRENRAVELANHTTLIARDGTERPIEDSAAPILDENVVEGVVLVFHDVTERRKAEAERERLLGVLRENDRLKDEFLAMLAHELRNPLAAIGNAVAVARRDGSADNADWALDVVDRQSRHLTRLIDDLLDVARITRGRIELARSVIDAAAFLAAACETAAPFARQREQVLTAHFPRGELWLDADPTRLEQVVSNLLINATKYTQRGGRVTLTAGREGADIVIAVSDTGIGIAPELLPRVFDLFAQGDRSLARSEGGLGIGLTVVKRLVELHGGSVSARSGGPGLGSEFRVRLPAAAPPETTDDADGRAAPCEARPARILVVDDNVDTARSLARLLKLSGHDVRTAHDGPEALEEAREQRPEFILLDIGLPEMDGYEVARRLRESGHAGAVIIAISGYGREEDRRRSREAGFNHHLSKPLDHDALLTLLGAPGGVA